MRKVKSYTGIWSVEKVIYAIQDMPLIFPLTMSQVGWGVSTLMVVLMFSNFPPISLIDNVLLKYIAIPVGVTWLMGQKSFDGKRPFSFLKSVFLYFFQPKVMYAGKPIKKEVRRFDERVTVVESIYQNKIENERGEKDVLSN